jgi:hypothetical protein
VDVPSLETSGEVSEPTFEERCRTLLYDHVIEFDSKHGGRVDERTQAILNLMAILVSQPHIEVPTDLNRL